MQIPGYTLNEHNLLNNRIYCAECHPDMPNAMRSGAVPSRDYLEPIREK